jgi:HD-GYP domain-containing protein (c-di-GMP phosphodiesterase class II)
MLEPRAHHPALSAEYAAAELKLGAARGTLHPEAVAAVHHHVEHILSKLGVSTRAAATVVALQHGLLADPLEPVLVTTSSTR